MLILYITTGTRLPQDIVSPLVGESLRHSLLPVPLLLAVQPRPVFLRAVLPLLKRKAVHIEKAEE